MKYQKISKQAILEATAAVIAQKGLDKTSVDDIIEVAKVSKGSIYFHFQSKDELLMAAIRFTAEERIKQIKIALKQTTSPKKKLQKLFEANSRMLTVDRDAFLMTYALLLSSHNDIRTRVAAEYIANYIEFVAEIIEKGIVLNEFKKVSPKEVATALVLSNDISGILKLTYPEFSTPNEIISNLFNLLFK